MKYIISACLLVVLAACGNHSNNKEEQEQKPAEKDIITLTAQQQANAGIVTGNAELRNMAGVLKVSGKIDVPPQNLISVSVPMGGYLKSTQLLPGMHVTRGEVIATIEDQQYIQLQQDYLTPKAKLQYAQADLQRQKELNADKASSDKVYQQAQAEYAMLHITVRSLAEKLRLIGIEPGVLSPERISKSIYLRAPINGFVSKVNVNIGKYVTPSDIMFELINPSDIHLNLRVFEKDLQYLSIGQRVTAYTNNAPEKKYTGEIILISKDVAADRSTDVHCHFDEYDKVLLPGMYMNAEIDMQSQQLAALPADAIVRYNSADFIFVETGSYTYKMISVKTGVKENGFVALELPEAAKDRKIVVKGAYNLLMALKNKED